MGAVHARIPSRVQPGSWRKGRKRVVEPYFTTACHGGAKINVLRIECVLVRDWRSRRRPMSLRPPLSVTFGAI